MVVFYISEMLNRIVKILLVPIVMKTNLFILESVKISLHRSVIIRIPSFAHALRDAHAFTVICEGLGCILASLIRVQNKVRAYAPLRLQGFIK